jgi:hypothetical protein
MENSDAIAAILIGIIVILFLIIIFLLLFSLPQNYQQGYDVGYKAGSKELVEKLGECEERYLTCKGNLSGLNESLVICKTDLENCTKNIIENFSQYRINLFNNIINLQKFVSIFILGFSITIILSLINVKIESKYLDLFLLILIVLILIYLYFL